MRVYSFQNTVVVVNGVEITGWADGDDVIEIKRLADSASHKIGAGGDMMLSLSSDKSGSFKFKLQQTSPSNKYLSNLVQMMEQGAAQFVPISTKFQDTYRQDLAQGTSGYLLRPTDLTRGDKGNNQEWEIIVEQLTQLLGDPGQFPTF